MVAPKPATKAINAINGVPTRFKCKLASNAPLALHLAEATINGIIYRGRGPSEKAAEKDISDQALRDIVVAIMVAREKSQEEHKETFVEEVLPKEILSYAIHRLFADWKARGYCMKCGGAKSMDRIDPCTCNGAVASIAHLLKRKEDGPSEAGPSSAVGSSKSESTKGESTSAAGSIKSSSSAVAAGSMERMNKKHGLYDINPNYVPITV